MKYFVIIGFLIAFFCSCSQSDNVRISGYVQGNDSVVSLWFDDSIFLIKPDKSGYFNEIVPTTKNGYATFSGISFNIYLASGEDLEINIDYSNVLSSLNFAGSLGGINNYLKEQEVAVFFDKSYYELSEDTFIMKMTSLLDEKVKLLLAKNFDANFTSLEKARVKYLVASQVAIYPNVHRRILNDDSYEPGQPFLRYMNSLSLNEERLISTREYRDFLYNYLSLQEQSYTKGVLDYITMSISNTKVKDYMLTQIVYQYILNNNGLEDTDDLLSTYYNECKNRSYLDYINNFVAQWKKLMPGNVAPLFNVTGLNGDYISLKDFYGSYVYISVWATWCVPCKNELPYLRSLSEVYKDKNIVFLTIAEDGVDKIADWKSFMSRHNVAGVHAIADGDGDFSRNYMIVSVPRYILIDKEGKIINSNAPRPSGPIRVLLDSILF